MLWAQVVGVVQLSRPMVYEGERNPLNCIMRVVTRLGCLQYSGCNICPKDISYKLCSIGCNARDVSC